MLLSVENIKETFIHKLYIEDFLMIIFINRINDIFEHYDYSGSIVFLRLVNFYYLIKSNSNYFSLMIILY